MTRRLRHPADGPLQPYWYAELVDSSNPLVKFPCDHRHFARTAAQRCAIRWVRSRTSRMVDRNSKILDHIPTSLGYTLKFEDNPQQRED